MNIAVIGAGISGLTAAYELTKKGHHVTIFEQADAPGGLGGYVKLKKNYIEKYYHHFFQSDKEIIRLTKELRIENYLKYYKAKTGMYKNGKIYPFSSPTDVLKYKPLSFMSRIRCGMTVAFLKFIPIPLEALDTVSAKKWLLRFAGKEVYENVWKPLLEGKFSEYASDVPALWLWGRVFDRSFKLGYFDGSVKVLFEKMVKTIKKNGGELRFGTRIDSLKIQKNNIQIHAHGKKYQFDKCILTALSPTVAKILDTEISAKQTKQLEKNDHLGAVCLILELRHPVQSQYWLNICEKNAPVLVMVEHTNMINKSDYAGRSVVYLANYIHRDDPRFKKNDIDIIKEYTSYLKTINPLFKDSWVLSSHLSKVPKAQTIFKTGSLHTRPPIEILPPHIYMINIDQMYPHDRNLNQGAELGKKVAQIIENSHENT